MILIILGNAQSSDKLGDDSRIVRFFKGFYFDEDYEENHPVIAVASGFSDFISHDLRMTKDFAPTFNFDISYGFARYYKIDGIDNLLFRRGEYITAGNISRNFKTLRVQSEGINSDSWRFGVGLKDGYIMQSNNYGDISFLHSSTFMMVRPDFDDFNSTESENEFIGVYRRNYKFGTSFNSSVGYKLAENWHFELAYDKLLIEPSYNFFPWLGSWLIDNVMQRWVDIYEDYCFDNFGRDWAWIKFIYKTGVSYFFYKLREHEGYFPFNSESTISSDAFKLNIELIF